MLAWVALNVLQACFTGLDGDEAYYWIYSRNLQWGYFDHPPMVALSIKLGELFGHGPLFTRLGAILFSAGTIFFGFKALPEQLRLVKWYVLVFTSVLIFHIYGFVVTPDSPLLFFTALFFYAYRLYLKKEDARHILFLAFSIVGLMYSKYHGILPVFFVFLSNPALIRKRSAWLVVLLVTAAFLPHLIWQYHHGWPTIRYHLFERSRGVYKIEKTTNYLLGQLLVWGPLTTLPALFFFFRQRQKDRYLRAHQFMFWGVLLFFLFSAFKKNIEPHWTLTGGISFMVLLMQVLSSATAKIKKLFAVLLSANILLVLAARALLVLPNSPAKNIDRLKVQIYSKAWADSIYKITAGTPVVFVDNYSHAALYQYYHPAELSTCYSTINYRKNNFNLSDESLLNNKSVYAMREYRMADDDVEVKSGYVPTFLHKADSFRAVNGLKILWLNETKEGRAGGKIMARLQLSNPMGYAITADTTLCMNYTFFKTKFDHLTSGNIHLPDRQLPPGYSKALSKAIALPAQPGKYRLVFSFVQPSFLGNFGSAFFDITVK
jgi:hypothetical protein